MSAINNTTAPTLQSLSTVPLPQRRQLPQLPSAATPLRVDQAARHIESFAEYMQSLLSNQRT